MLMSIDPGINNCGVAVVDFTDAFKVLEVFNIANARKFTPLEKEVEVKFGTRVVKVTHIVQCVADVLARYPKIEHITIEAPFYNALTPMAYGSLLEVISAIKYGLIVPRGLDFSMTEPLLVKKIFLNTKITKGMTAKVVMREFMQRKVDEGVVLVDKLVPDMTEHEIDAIAIAFVKVLTTLREMENEQQSQS